MTSVDLKPEERLCNLLRVIVDACSRIVDNTGGFVESSRARLYIRQQLTRIGEWTRDAEDLIAEVRYDQFGELGGVNVR